MDTNFFGSFARAQAIGIADDDYYVFCGGPNSAFTLKENSYNVADIGKEVSNISAWAV